MKDFSMSPCNPSRSNQLHRQRGAAALLAAVVILFLTTLAALYVSRTALIEQRMSANELRHKQAFEAAQAGMDRAYLFLSATPQGVDKDLNGDPDLAATTNGLLATLNNGSQYVVAFCEPVRVLAPTTKPQPPPDPNVCPNTPADQIQCPSEDPEVLRDPAELRVQNFSTPLVIACGWSDDLSARHTIMQGVGTNRPLATTPQIPLTAKGAMNVGGSANVVNYYNNLTVWSGGALTSIGNAGKTFVRNPSVPPPSPATAPPDPPGSCTTSSDYVCLTDKNSTGPDVIQSDPTLVNISAAQLFMNYFGRTLPQIIEDVSTRSILGSDKTALGSLAKAQGETIVISGNTTLPNVNGASAIGTRDRPVVLIIDGSLDLQGTPEVNGIVYVTGDVTGGGNLLVKGAMVVAGNVQPTGSVDIIFDPLATGNTENSGRAGLMPGTWRDWR